MAAANKAAEWRVYSYWNPAGNLDEGRFDRTPTAGVRIDRRLKGGRLDFIPMTPDQMIDLAGRLIEDAQRLRKVEAEAVR
jgi:hypothetical protein